ncbi:MULTISPECIES: precorrin-4 C(11)-methyltransferase [Thiorhodovibrio]|uniref:precorrin-4 C(11)-methyltransferase n=1 Tax=Thiorhodovibrio TaxID=61593 RepID=UPI0019146CB0|nr:MULTISPECIES: precorrin-4 C(11)-methyltransferase [Thiorhodovibrio]MBK5970701.1 precorrin-4 C(11)-methyltransferase [Thiorhodovibrio winogradskyi]WPL14246.1 Cobalt-precorrin-4 C(11)-methyltransferase [Thiorhodovibrio litoralis]
MGKLWFIGAGPGAADLLTVRATRLLGEAGAVLYTGSLVAGAALQWAGPDCEIADSKGMDLSEVRAWLLERLGQHQTVVRLQTGDPTLYGVIPELARPLDAAGIEIGIVPGVSSAMAAAAAAGESLTLPEVTQSVIFTRLASRTPMPASESFADLARHGCTLCIFLSIDRIEEVVAELRRAGWAEDAPVVVAHKVSWPDEERILRGTLADIAAECRAAGIDRQALILVSPALGARDRAGDDRVSKLYDAAFPRRFRQNRLSR